MCRRHRAIFRNLTVAENLQIVERRKGDLAARQDFIFELFPDLKKQVSSRQQLLAREARPVYAVIELYARPLEKRGIL